MELDQEARVICAGDDVDGMRSALSGVAAHNQRLIGGWNVGCRLGLAIAP